jgi:hypothetical protein
MHYELNSRARQWICLAAFLAMPQAWGQAWIHHARLFSPEVSFPMQLENRVAERARIEGIVARAERQAERAKYEKTLVAKRRFFAARTNHQAIDALAAKFVAHEADGELVEKKLRRILEVLHEDARRRNRVNELSASAAFWLMSCERALNGRQLSEENYEALMAGLDEIFEGYSELDRASNQRKQTSFEMMGMLGGVITWLDLEKGSDSTVQALKLATESLALFQLTPQNLGRTIRLLIWLGNQRA